MIGNLFAGTDESPGELILYQGRTLQGVPRHGLDWRDAQGQPRPLLPGRLRARERTSAAGKGSMEKLVPEGIEGRVPHKGSLSPW